MTSMEGYRAAHCFLQGLWEDTELDELGDFLGAMSLLEHQSSADPALLENWRAAFHAAGEGGDLRPDQVFGVMLAFLKRWAEQGTDGTMDGLCHALEETGPSWTGWDESVLRVLDGGYDAHSYWVTGPVSEQEAP